MRDRNLLFGIRWGVDRYDPQRLCSGYSGSLRGVAMRLDRSKLFEWLLDNECPYDWDVDEKSSNDETVTLIFSEDT